MSKGNQQKHQEIANELQMLLTGNINRQITVFSLINNFNLRNLLDLRNFLDLLDLRNLLDLPDLRNLPDLLDIRNDIDYAFIILKVPDVLKDNINSYSLSALFCLYSVIATNGTVTAQYSQQIQSSLQRFIGSIPTQQALEQRLLAEAVLRVLEQTSSVVSNTSPSFSAPTVDRAIHINELQQHTSLSKQDAVELLSACTDTRKVGEETWQNLISKKRFMSTRRTVGEVAWSLLSQPWSMDAEAEIFVVHALDDKNALVCAAAATLLQQVKMFEAGERGRAAEKIMTILRDDKLSRRPLNTPGGGIQRLDDLLFETLRVLVE